MIHEVDISKPDVDLALHISRIVHNQCRDVPHDIGLTIESEIRRKYKIRQAQRLSKSSTNLAILAAKLETQKPKRISINLKKEIDKLRNE